MGRGQACRPVVWAPWALQSRDRPSGGALGPPLASPRPSLPWALSLRLQRAGGPHIWAEPCNLGGTPGEAGGRPGPLGPHGGDGPPSLRCPRHPPQCQQPRLLIRGHGGIAVKSCEGGASGPGAGTQDALCRGLLGVPGPLVPQGEGASRASSDLLHSLLRSETFSASLSCPLSPWGSPSLGGLSPPRGSLPPWGSLSPWGSLLPGGSLSPWGSLPRGLSLSLGSLPVGLSPWGSLPPWGVSLWGSLSLGVSPPGGLSFPGGSLPLGVSPSLGVSLPGSLSLPRGLSP